MQGSISSLFEWRPERGRLREKLKMCLEIGVAFVHMQVRAQRRSRCLVPSGVGIREMCVAYRAMKQLSHQSRCKLRHLSGAVLRGIECTILH
jgi:hypothetical protein